METSGKDGTESLENGKMIIGKMGIGKMSIGKMSISIGRMSIGKMSIGRISRQRRIYETCTRVCVCVSVCFASMYPSVAKLATVVITLP
tara:strand:+ start:1124 stop:1390 length:267 start_codon:yes stop_codon:yes gene_type:complete